MKKLTENSETTFNDCKVVDGQSHWQVKRGEKVIFTIEKWSVRESLKEVQARVKAGSYNL